MLNMHSNFSVHSVFLKDSIEIEEMITNLGFMPDEI